MYIEKNVKIGKNSRIFPLVYIGKNVEIGENTIIQTRVKIQSHTRIGNYCIIESGAVIGSDGFGFAAKKDGSYVAIPQTGNVVIKDNVRIGANTVIDRATVGSTLISENNQLGHLVQVAHNVKIYKNAIIRSQTGISGSSEIGGKCDIGNQTGISGHLNIASGVKTSMKSGLMNHIKKENSEWAGAPVILIEKFIESEALFRKLFYIEELVKKLENIS